jgi:hypothetical protein
MEDSGEQADYVAVRVAFEFNFTFSLGQVKCFIFAFSGQ